MAAASPHFVLSFISLLSFQHRAFEKKQKKSVLKVIGVIFTALIMAWNGQCTLWRTWPPKRASAFSLIMENNSVRTVFALYTPPPPPQSSFNPPPPVCVRGGAQQAGKHLSLLRIWGIFSRSVSLSFLPLIPFSVTFPALIIPHSHKHPLPPPEPPLTSCPPYLPPGNWSRPKLFPSAVEGMPPQHAEGLAIHKC